MMLSDLDGFLTAVAIGPEVILPGEWLPVLWGGGAPEFKDQMQAQRIRKTVLGRYSEILSTLQTDPDALEPIVSSKDDNTAIVGDRPSATASWTARKIVPSRLRNCYRPRLTGLLSQPTDAAIRLPLDDSSGGA